MGLGSDPMMGGKDAVVLSKTMKPDILYANAEHIG
jgi:hypothetical protein